MSLVEPVGRVGPLTAADSTKPTIRMSRDSSLVTQDSHARFQEAVARGNVYTIQAKTVTVTVTTDISPLPATTGRAGVAVYNPVGSGVNLVIWKLIIAHLSGTPGGPAYLDVLDNAGCTVTNKTDAINNLSLKTGGHKAQCYAAAVPANTAVARMLRPVAGSPTAIVFGVALSFEDLIDGSIIIPPGGMLALSWHAVGTSHIYSAALTFEETPT